METASASTLSPTPVAATFGARLIARIIDACVVTAIDVLLGQVLGFGYGWLVLGAVIVLGYFAVLDAAIGTTVGKAVMKLRVIGPDGAHPSLASAVRREAFMLVGAVPFIGPLVAIGLWIWFSLRIRSDARGQGPHDHFAGGTRVVQA